MLSLTSDLRAATQRKVLSLTSDLRAATQRKVLSLTSDLRAATQRQNAETLGGMHDEVVS